jgi:hypothetical protein
MLQATPDHFVLTGSEHPTYERAEEVKPGDTVWLLANPKDTQLTPARVVSTRRVTNIGLYAPLTLSGSIIVNNVAASVHRWV